MGMSDALASTDVVIVGAGIAGMCTAFELRRRGFGVTVVEQRFPSFGSSSRNPGALWLQTRRRGTELELARASKAIYTEYVDELGNVFDYREHGGLFFFETDEQQAVLEDYVKHRRAAGLDIDFVTRAQALDYSSVLPSTAIGAVYCSDDAQVDSRRFVEALVNAGTRAGIKRFENTAVLSTVRRGDTVIGVRTLRGDIQAAGVVWATGAWARTLGPEDIALPLSTSRMGQMKTQPIDHRPSAIMHGPRGVASCGALVDLPSFRTELFGAPSPDRTPESDSPEDWNYDDVITQNADGTLQMGCSIDVSDSLNPHISIRGTQAMVSTSLERYEALGKQGVTGLWAGLHTDTPDHLPIVDRVRGAFVNTGHCSGIGTAPIAGRALAQIIAGESSPFSDELRADRPSLG